jgi:hypothetical protein
VAAAEQLVDAAQTMKNPHGCILISDAVLQVSLRSAACELALVQCVAGDTKPLVASAAVLQAYAIMWQSCICRKQFS